MTEKERIKFISKLNEEIAEKNGNRFFVGYISSWWYGDEPHLSNFLKSEVKIYDFTKAPDQEHYNVYHFDNMDFVFDYASRNIKDYISRAGGEI